MLIALKSFGSLKRHIYFLGPAPEGSVANETEWSSTDAELIDGYSLSAGTTYYARVRAIKSGLAGTYSSTLSFTTDSA